MSTPPRTPLRGSVEDWAERAPDREALREGSRRLTWQEWNRAANRLAELLATRGGVRAGDRVALCMQNCLEWFITQAATAKLDAALVPISWRLTPEEVHYIVADSGARAFVFDRPDAASLARCWTDTPPLPEGKRTQVRLALSVEPPSEPGVLAFPSAGANGEIVARFATQPPRSIVYTSGTTGRPRGVVGRTRKPKQGARTAPLPDDPHERNLLGAPLNHAAGQGSARATLLRGGRVYVMPRFDAAEALRIISEERITTTFLVPTMLSRILALPEQVLAGSDVSSLRTLRTGASPCPQSLKERVIAFFGSHCLVEGYGTTEVGVVARMEPEDHLRKPGACGRVVRGVEVRILDADRRPVPHGEPGEVYVRTPVMIERYLNQAAPDFADGFFGTGDIGRLDEDGYLYIIDRKKDMIISGGVNIYPAEIEEALRRHPAVLDAAVFGVPHPEWGEQVRAVVECVPGRDVSESELVAFLADKVASYKRPRAIERVEEIPRNPAGKVLKTELRAPYWAGTGKTI